MSKGMGNEQGDGQRVRGLASKVVVITKQERRHAKVAGLQVMLPRMFELQVNQPLKSHFQIT